MDQASAPPASESGGNLSEPPGRTAADARGGPTGLSQRFPSQARSHPAPARYLPHTGPIAVQFQPHRPSRLQQQPDVTPRSDVRTNELRVALRVSSMSIPDAPNAMPLSR